MKKVLIMSILLMSNFAFASVSCLIDFNQEGVASTCTEQSSNIPEMEEGFRRACEMHANSTVVNICPGNIGCKIAQGVGEFSMATTIWYNNGESEEDISYVCNGMNGRVVTK